MEMREKYAKIVEIPFNSTNKYQVCGSGRPNGAGWGGGKGGELEALQGLPLNLKVSFYLNIIGEMKPLSGCCWGSWRWGLKGKGESVYTSNSQHLGSPRVREGCLCGHAYRRWVFTCEHRHSAVLASFSHL